MWVSMSMSMWTSVESESESEEVTALSRDGRLQCPLQYYSVTVQVAALFETIGESFNSTCKVQT